MVGSSALGQMISPLFLYERWTGIDSRWFVENNMIEKEFSVVSGWSTSVSSSIRLEELFLYKTGRAIDISDVLEVATLVNRF